jgi:hypothetical protein
VLQTKRQQVWRDGQVELQTLPLAEVRKRVALRDWRGVGLEQVMLGYAVPRDLANHHRDQGKRPWLMSAERPAMWYVVCLGETERARGGSCASACARCQQRAVVLVGGRR